MGLDIDPEQGTADSGDLESDLADLFLAIGEAAQDRGRAVAVIIDEIQYLDETEMSALIMAMHRLSQRQSPMTLIAAGLPQLVGLAGRSKSYAERLFQYPAVGPLAVDDARDALRDPLSRQGVAITDTALDALVKVTRGYPYFIQEWGYQVWNAAAASPIDIDAVQRATTARKGVPARARGARRRHTSLRGCRCIARREEPIHRTAEIRLDPQGHDLQPAARRYRLHRAAVRGVHAPNHAGLAPAVVRDLTAT